MTTNSQTIKIPIPSPIPENHQFKEIAEINKLLMDSFKIIRVEQALRTDTDEIEIHFILTKLDQPQPIYRG